MAGLSLFPDGIDSFTTHQDIAVIDASNVNRYKELKLKTVLSTAENTELNTLTNTLRSKVFFANDLNKLQECMVNIETFTKTRIDSYIADLRTQMGVSQGRFDDLYREYNTRLTNLNTQAANQVTEFNTMMSNMQTYASEYLTYAFDNAANWPGTTYSITGLDTNIVTETRYVTGSPTRIWARRVTDLGSSGNIALETITFYDASVSPATTLWSRTITYKNDLSQTVVNS